MDEIESLNLGFSYTSGPLPPSGKEIVDSITYTYTDASQRPPNTADPGPANGPRDLDNSIAPTALVWQYYRTVTGSIGGAGQSYEIKIITPGQPSFAVTGVTQDLKVPPNFEIGAINLTWRIVQIQLSPENQMRFLSAKMEALKKRT
ncbi:MAG: hypothetical protein AAGD38_11150 [Acidobacteriota bacterium]